MFPSASVSHYANPAFTLHYFPAYFFSLLSFVDGNYALKDRTKKKNGVHLRRDNLFTSFHHKRETALPCTRRLAPPALTQ